MVLLSHTILNVLYGKSRLVADFDFLFRLVFGEILQLPCIEESGVLPGWRWMSAGCEEKSRCKKDLVLGT